MHVLRGAGFCEQRTGSKINWKDVHILRSQMLMRTARFEWIRDNLLKRKNS